MVAQVVAAHLTVVEEYNTMYVRSYIWFSETSMYKVMISGCIVVSTCNHH